MSLNKIPVFFLIICSLYVHAEEERYALGTVLYQESKPIYSQSDAVVTKLYVRGGQSVAKGEPLFIIKNQELGYSSVQIKNDMEGATVSRVNVLEGSKVEKFTEILVLTKKNKYLVRFNLAQEKMSLMKNITEYEVIFNPSSLEPILEKGEVYAIHEPKQGSFGLMEVDIIVECSEHCINSVWSGSVAKIILDTKS